MPLPALPCLPLPFVAAAMSIEFSDIVISAGKTKKRGQLSLVGTSLSEARFVFQSKAPKPIEIRLENIEFLYWVEVGKNVSEGGFVVKIALQQKAFAKFSGFSASAYNTIQAWLLACGKSLTIEKVSTRGANWGHIKVSDHRILFEDKEGMTIFDVPTASVAQTVFQGKSDVRTHTHNTNKQTDMRTQTKERDRMEELSPD